MLRAQSKGICDEVKAELKLIANLNVIRAYLDENIMKVC